MQDWEIKNNAHTFNTVLARSLDKASISRSTLCPYVVNYISENNNVLHVFQKIYASPKKLNNLQF